MAFWILTIQAKYYESAGHLYFEAIPSYKYYTMKTFSPENTLQKWGLFYYSVHIVHSTLNQNKQQYDTKTISKICSLQTLYKEKKE